jgi:hypothetical protein
MAIKLMVLLGSPVTGGANQNENSDIVEQEYSNGVQVCHFRNLSSTDAMTQQWKQPPNASCK